MKLEKLQPYQGFEPSKVFTGELQSQVSHLLIRKQSNRETSQTGRRKHRKPAAGLEKLHRNDLFTLLPSGSGDVLCGSSSKSFFSKNKMLHVWIVDMMEKFEFTKPKQKVILKTGFLKPYIP